MARPRKPAAVQKLSGAWDKDPNREREEFDAGDLGGPPEHLTEMESAAWRELQSFFPDGVLMRTDRWAVELAAVLMVQARTLRAEFPVSKLSNLRSLLGQLGMTAADRSKVNIGKPEKEKKVSGPQFLN